MMIIILANDDEDKLMTPVTLSRKLINEAIIRGKLLNNVRAVIKMNWRIIRQKESYLRQIPKSLTILQNISRYI